MSITEIVPHLHFRQMPEAQEQAVRKWGAMHGVPIADQLIGHPLVLDNKNHTITLTLCDRETSAPYSAVFQLEAGPLPFPDGVEVEWR